MKRKGSNLENLELKKSKFENENVFRKEITHQKALQIFNNCKQNNGFYEDKDEVYNEIVEKYSWIYSNNSIIKLLNYSQMKSGNFKIETSLINKFNKIIIIVFAITTTQGNHFITLIKWFSIDKKFLNNQDEFTIINFIGSDIEYNNFYQKQQEQHSQQHEIIIENKEESKNIPLLQYLDTTQILEGLDLKGLEVLLLNYLHFMSEILLLKLSSLSDEKTIINNYLEIKNLFPLLFNPLIDPKSIYGIHENIFKQNKNRTFLNNIRLFFLWFLIIDIKDNFKINNINDDVSKVIGNKYSNKNIYLDFENIKLPFVSSWLNFEEYLSYLESLQYLNNYSLSLLLKDIKLKSSIQYSTFKKSEFDTYFKEYFQDDYLSIENIEINNKNNFIKIKFLFFFKIINSPHQSNFSLINKKEWNVYIEKGFIYLHSNTFLLKFFPKLQRFISYKDYLLKILAIPFKDQYFYFMESIKNFKQVFNEKLKNEFFAKSDDYTIYSIFQFLKYLNKKPIKQIKQYKTMTLKEDTIPDIEDLFKKNLNNYPPCIKNTFNSNVYLKDHDRLTLTNYFAYLKYTEEDVKFLYKDKKSSEIDDILTQFKWAKNRKDKKYLSCHALFNTGNLSALKCPYEQEFASRQNNLNKYDFQQKSEIISQCQKKSDIGYFYSPAHWIIQNVNK
jgi:hypothetical protein